MKTLNLFAIIAITSITLSGCKSIGSMNTNVSYTNPQNHTFSAGVGWELKSTKGYSK